MSKAQKSEKEEDVLYRHLCESNKLFIKGSPDSKGENKYIVAMSAKPKDERSEGIISKVFSEF